MEGMTRIVPKPGKGGRMVKSENFAINEPGREPFYVHAYYAGTPDQCTDLQVRFLFPEGLLVVGGRGCCGGAGLPRTFVDGKQGLWSTVIELMLCVCVC